MLRFIHCADLHFDRTFEGLHLITQVKELPLANNQVLEKIVTLALDEQVDFLVFAGDIFHQNRPSLKTQHQFFKQINRLKEQDIPVYMIFGNHDYFEKERYWFDFPENIHLFTEEKVRTIHGKNKTGESYAISGFSYQHPWITTSKVSEFPKKAATYHIGMYHGDSNGERFAPFQIQEMRQKNYDYWALGHIHVPTVLSKMPPIIYPGTPQGHTQKEKETGVQLVTLDGMKVHYETKKVAAVTWEDYELSLLGIKSRKDALEAMKAFFQTSQRQLVKFSLKDTEHLPTNWLNNREKPELIAYLNEYLVQNDFEQIVYQLEVNAVPESEKLVLTGKEVMAQLLASYQTNEVFETIIEELATHPLIKRTISSQTLKEETLAQVKTTLEQEFCWSEEE